MTGFFSGSPLQVEEIVVGILERLTLQLDPNTKEEILRALCLLAGNSTDSVVPLLLNRPLPWDRYLSHTQEHTPSQ